MAMGVSISPGMMVFTRMPYRALLRASCWPNMFMPIFDNLYAVNPGA